MIIYKGFFIINVVIFYFYFNNNLKGFFMKSLINASIFIMILSFASVCFAQDPAPAADPAAPATAPADNAAPAADTRMGFAELTLGLNMCQGDCDNVDSSWGLGISGFYMVLPNVAVGGTIHYDTLSMDNVDTLYTMSFGVEGRYFHKIMPKLNVFGLGGLGLVQYAIEAGGMEDDDSGYYVDLGFGVDYEVAPKINVGAIVKYQMRFWDELADADVDFNGLYIGVKGSYSF
jgi:Outer membrane protein beta-barrel domain